MKKYKLIKWYPGLPPYWKNNPPVVKKNAQGDYYAGSPTGNTYIKGQNVENNPEFWEKIVEKNYEILKLKGKNSGNIVKYKFGHFLKLFDIHSVKRISDGEVFTVGDRVRVGNVNMGHIIESMKIDEKRNSIYVSGRKDRQRSFGQLLENIEHDPLSEPVFTTEDGVDIYEGDTYYFISPIIKDKITKVSSATNNSNGSYADYYFSSREKAQQWIEDNEPKYSKKDIKDALKNSLFHIASNCQVVDVTRVRNKLNL